MGRGWGRQPTYTAVLSKSMFSGVGTPEYDKAQDPANLIKNEVECNRLQLTVDVALGVMTGSIPDPDAGRGNPVAPGCFYYMTKQAFAAHTEWNAKNPGKKPKFAPTWDKLPGTASDKHCYRGIEPEGPFKP